MFKVGELIVYGGEGVCRVEAIGAAPLPLLDADKTYYTLQPLYRSGLIYAPTDVAVPMRPVIDRAEAEKLILGIRDLDESKPQQTSLREKTALYRSYLSGYACADLILLIRLLHAQNRHAQAQGRRQGQTEERFMRRAKELLYGELAVALSIQPDEVEDVIARMVEASA